MTWTGKIFTFVVLFLSLFQGAFMIFVYAQRTRWASKYEELDTKYKVAQSNVDQYAKERDDAVRDGDKRVAEVKKETKKIQDDYDAQLVELKKHQAAEQQRQLALQQTNAAVQKAQLEVQRMQADLQQMTLTLNKQLDENKKLVDLNNTLRQDKIQSDVALSALRDRTNGLEKQLEDIARETARSKVSAVGGTGARYGPNPPTEKIEGLIRQTDQSGLVKITIGSDAGLVKGHTLEVFRLSNIPDQSKYLGRIKIIDVSATEAVGQPMGRMAAPLQVGDTVASRILGS
jgi:hypothetical protein